MYRYLVESPHTREEYYRMTKCIDACGYITHCEWGCTCGIHKGWAIVEADSEIEALLYVPPYVRRKAKAIKLSRFTPEIIKSFHASV